MKIVRKECRVVMKREWGVEYVVLVVKIKIKVDVKWQDGIKFYGVEVFVFVLVEYFGDYEFWFE